VVLFRLDGPNPHICLHHRSPAPHRFGPILREFPTT
jgi:hypothetical protein